MRNARGWSVARVFLLAPETGPDRFERRRTVSAGAGRQPGLAAVLQVGGAVWDQPFPSDCEDPRSPGDLFGDLPRSSHESKPFQPRGDPIGGMQAHGGPLVPLVRQNSSRVLAVRLFGCMQAVGARIGKREEGIPGPHSARSSLYGSDPRASEDASPLRTPGRRALRQAFGSPESDPARGCLTSSVTVGFVHKGTDQRQRRNNPYRACRGVTRRGVSFPSFGTRL